MKLKELLQRWGGRWFWPWQLDLRSVAVFRMLLAVAVLMHLAMAAVDLRWFLSDEGFLARESVRVIPGGQLDATYGLGFYFWNGSVAWAALGVGITAVLAVVLLVGYRSRLTAGLLWFMIASLHMRMPEVTNAGETILRYALLWSVLLPIGARFSLDRGLSGDFARRVEGPAPGAEPTPDADRDALWSGVAALGLTAQIGYNYLFAGLFKSGPTWWDGTAIRDVLSQLMYNRPPFSDLILRLPDLILRPMTHALVGFEILGMALLLVPLPRVRLLTVLGLMSLHLGFTVFMTVGLFPVYCLAWLCALLPPLVWGRHRAGRGFTVFHAGTSATNRRLALAWMGLSGLEDARLAPAQFDGAARARLPHTWTVRDPQGRDFTRFEGVRRVLRAGPFASLAWLLWPLRSLLSTRPGSGLDRRRGGWNRHGTSPFPPRFTAAFAAALLAFVSWINIAQGMNLMAPAASRTLQRTALFQLFTVFPTTQLFTAHFMVVATLRDGTEVDLFRHYVGGLGDEVVWTRQTNLQQTFGGRWWNWRDELFRNYVLKFDGQNDDVKYRLAGLGRVLCRQWNAERAAHGEYERVGDELRFVWVEYPDDPDAPVLTKVVWSGSCR